VQSMAARSIKLKQICTKFFSLQAIVCGGCMRDAVGFALARLPTPPPQTCLRTSTAHDAPDVTGKQGCTLQNALRGGWMISCIFDPEASGPPGRPDTASWHHQRPPPLLLLRHPPHTPSQCSRNPAWRQHCGTRAQRPGRIVLHSFVQSTRPIPLSEKRNVSTECKQNKGHRYVRTYEVQTCSSWLKLGCIPEHCVAWMGSQSPARSSKCQCTPHRRKTHTSCCSLPVTRHTPLQCASSKSSLFQRAVAPYAPHAPSNASGVGLSGSRALPVETAAAPSQTQSRVC